MTKLAKPTKPKTWKNLVPSDNPVLREVALEVKEITPFVKGLINDLLWLMQKHRGMSIAAPQIGAGLRVCVMLYLAKRMVLINPRIVHSGGAQVALEGCLTFPRKWIELERPQFAKVKYLDHDLIAREITFEGLYARCIFHEIDHLNGKLIEDYGPLVDWE